MTGIRLLLLQLLCQRHDDKMKNPPEPIDHIKLLAVSDTQAPIIYSSHIKARFSDIDLSISCGDLSYYYLEYIISMLNIPLYYVNGNHNPIEINESGEMRCEPWGAINLHKQVIYNRKYDLILAGIEGSLRYNKGKHQYTQGEMLKMVLGLTPRLLLNKFRYNRYLDIFVTHASPKGIHDDDDRAHQGIKAFNWLVKVFQPSYHLHGHIHIYNPRQIRETKLGNTIIMNTYGYKEIDLTQTNK